MRATPEHPLHDQSLERGLVADIVLRNALDGALDAGLRTEHIGDPHAAAALDAAIRLRDAGEPLTAWTVAARLEAGGQTETAGMARGWMSRAADLDAIFEEIRGPLDDLDERIASVREWHRRRELAAIASSMRSQVLGGESAARVATWAADEIAGVDREQHASTLELGEVLAERLAGYATETPVTTTGIRDLDRRLNGGLRPGQLIVLGARPGVGKSALALNIARAVARSGKAALFVSLEMSAEELTDRLVAAESRVPLTYLQQGGLGERQLERIREAAPRIESLPLSIHDHGGAGVSGVRREAQRMARRGGLGLVVVDYLQLLAPETAQGRSRNDEVAAMSRGLKVLARELGVPVLALSQLNRGVEARAVKRPTLADLRDSGAVEQDADVVIFLSRDEQKPGLVSLEIAKHRNGPLSTIDLAWLPETLELGGLSRAEEF